ncbi:MAG: putative Ig domain-containing protein [Candidatus Omnitrophota bacterium]
MKSVIIKNKILLSLFFTVTSIAFFSFMVQACADEYTLTYSIPEHNRSVAIIDGRHIGGDNFFWVEVTDTAVNQVIAGYQLSNHEYDLRTIQEDIAVLFSSDKEELVIIEDDVLPFTTYPGTCATYILDVVTGPLTQIHSFNPYRRTYGNIWVDSQGKYLILINIGTPWKSGAGAIESYMYVYSLETCQMTDSVLVSDRIVTYVEDNGFIDARYDQLTGIMTVNRNIGSFYYRIKADGTIENITPVAGEAVFMIIDDFDNADPATNFLGLSTGVGNFGTGDFIADYDVYGGNPGNPLNTAHQVSWDGALGSFPDPEDAFWYSFVNDGSGPLISIADYTHLWLKLQAGWGEGVDPTIDIVGIDLQVNYPDGEIDQEGKPFRIYRAYQAVCNAQDLDIAAIPLSEFRDEYGSPGQGQSAPRFTDNLAYNSANLRAAAIAMTDHTDWHLTTGLNMDHRGTIFIEDVAFWNKNNATKNELIIDDFEDGDHITNRLGYATGGFNTASDSDVAFTDSARHEIIWDLNQTCGYPQYWRSDLSNSGQNLLDMTSFTHLAYDALISAADTGDIYDVDLVIDVAGVEKIYSFKKSSDASRISEEYIPLNKFRDGAGLYITPELLQRVKEIRLLFAYTETFYNHTLGDPSQGIIWIDNLCLVKLEGGPLHNYPPLVSTIDGQDVSYDFSWYPEAHRKVYGKEVLAGAPVGFTVIGSDYDDGISSLSADLASVPSADFQAVLNGSQVTGTFTWTPQLADVGLHTITFTVTDDKGAKDIQPFDINVTTPINPPWWGTGTVSGTVLDSATSEPIAGATVTLKPYAYGYGLHDITTATDENGDYNATDVQRYTQSSGGAVYWTKYTVYVSKDGYQNYVSEEIAFSATIFDIKHNTTLTPIPNNPPLFMPWEGWWEINEGESYLWVISVADPENDGFIVTAANMPEGMQLNEHATFTWQPRGDQAGDYAVLVTATDEHGAASNMNMTIRVKDTVPVYAQLSGNVIFPGVINTWPAQGMEVTLVPAIDDPNIESHSTSTDSNGQYVINDIIAFAIGGNDEGVYVPYKLHIAKDGFYEFTSDEFTLQSGTNNYPDVTVWQNPTIGGRVTDNITGQPIAGVVLTLKGAFFAQEWTFTANTDSNGMYEFSGLPWASSYYGARGYVTYHLYSSQPGYIDYISDVIFFGGGELDTDFVRYADPALEPADFIISPGDSIQEAIDASQSGDSIYVCSGIYEENITIQGKSINLVGENTSDTVIKGNILAENSAGASIENIFVQYKAGEPLIGKGSVWADFNLDGKVNLLDLGIMGDYWNQAGVSYFQGDANNDGKVNLLDLGIVGDSWYANYLIPGKDTYMYDSHNNLIVKIKIDGTRDIYASQGGLFTKDETFAASILKSGDRIIDVLENGSLAVYDDLGNLISVDKPIYDAGITVIDSGIKIKDCIIKPDPDIFQDERYGKAAQVYNLSIADSLQPFISNNLILNAKEGIYLYSDTARGGIEGEILNNTLHNNERGVLMRTNKEKTLIHHNIITRSTDAIHLSYASLLQERLANITNNCFGADGYGNTHNVWCDELGAEQLTLPDVAGNIAEDPEYTNPLGLDYTPLNPECDNKGYRME